MLVNIQYNRYHLKGNNCIFNYVKFGHDLPSLSQVILKIVWNILRASMIDMLKSVLLKLKFTKFNSSNEAEISGKNYKGF